MPGATSGEVAGPIRLPNGQLIGQPGSNGRVHRGPDRFPRRHYVRVMFLGALSDLGLSLEDLRRQRKHRKGSSLIPLAMLHHCKQGYKNIAIDAALGKPEAYGPFLRMMADAHKILQPAKDEVAGAQDRVPMPATFIRAPKADPPEAEQQPPARPTAPSTLVDANGQEYVAG